MEEYRILERESTALPDVGSGERAETVFVVTRERTTIDAAPGDFLVFMDQPLAHVAIYLLEPESDDGLVRWGWFDRLGPGDVYPVRRLMRL